MIWDLNYIILIISIMYTRRFDDTNTENLQKMMPKTGAESKMFYFDPKIINWDDYFLNTHVPGLIKYVF